MTVKELIDLLQKCNPDDIVMYSMENATKNEAITMVSDAGEVVNEMEFGVEDVLICSGTLRGFVFLTEDLLE